MLKVLKITSIQYLSNISRKNWVTNLMLNMKIFYKLILLFLKGFSRHAQSTQVSLQCLFDILRKKLGIKLGA